MANKVITLYIDDTSLKLLVAKGKEIKKWATLPLESGLVRGGVVVDRTRVAAKIKEFLKAQGVKGKKVIAGLSGLRCLLRVISLPYLPETMLAEGILWEAKRVLPVPPEETYLQWQIIPAPKEETRVFLAALPRNATDALIEALREAGVQPYLMDLAPLALARVASEATAIIIDTRPTEVDIVTMVEGVPQLIRTLPLPGEALSLQEKLPTIREELKRTIKFYNSSYPDKPLEPSVPILASGELGEEPQACQALADALNHSVLPLSPPLKCPEDFAPSQYMVNIGLALKELPLGKRASLSRVNLNVLPAVYQPKPIPLNKILTYLGIMVAIFLLASVVMLVQSSTAETALLQSQVDATNRLLKHRQEILQLQMAEIAEMEKKVTESEVTRNLFIGVTHELSRQQEIVNGDLALATHTWPTDIDMYLTRVTHTSDTLTITGTAQSKRDVSVYAKILRGSGRFSPTLISFLQKTETEITETEITETKMKFTLTLTAKEKD